ncbi:hypothetical protein LASUN_04930 [Lentilactobacillus sunkii]|uniref:ABC transporter permease n=1 Tax=Lentilactobacillus sunkii TaxID=481719 RepID=A0A1E7XHF6_9LACO|nr:ABC transporter permease [Lentilactobacillus sunkii]OFA12555.1 hypothetical protein LASUN_04930 [Lentilactobacillus sunkii]
MEQYTQTLTLLKANLKRDWIKITAWLIVLVGVFVAVAAKFDGIYGTTKQIGAISSTLRSKAMVALIGSVPDGHLTTAIIFTSEMAVFWGLFIIIFNYSLAVGSSRGQEESGLTEMVLGGHPVGRLAPLMAAALELLIANGLFALITGAGTMIANLPGSDINGTWLSAVAIAAVGWAFGMIALVFSQLVADSHNVSMYNYAFLGIVYLIRMMTDVSNPDYTWISPLGWLEKTEIYTNNNWWPVVVLAALGVVAFFGAVALNANRDIDAGIIHVNPGSRRSRFLRGPATLLVWNQKSLTIFWVVGMAVLGASYGSVFDSIGKIFNTSPTIQKVLGQTAVRHIEQSQVLSFIGLLGIIFSLLAVIAGVMIVNRLVTEERRRYLQMVMTKPQGRTYILAVYVVFGLILAAGLLFVALISAMGAGNVVMKHPIAFKYFWQTFVANLPAIAVFMALMVGLVGVYPRLRSLVWAYLGISFLISYFGNLMDLSKSVLKISPYYWTKKVPIESINTTPLIWMLVIAAVLIVIGFVGYKNRDLES